MEKVLDAGKNATYLLIGVCAALLVSALTEDSSESLEGAIEEAQGLANLRPADMARTLNMWRFEPVGGLRSSLKEPLGRLEDNLRSSLSRTALAADPALVSSALEVNVEIRGSAALPFVPRPDATLKELRDYFEACSPYRLLAVNPEPLEASVRSRIAQEGQFWRSIKHLEVQIDFDLERFVGFPGDNETLDYCDGTRELRLPPTVRISIVFLGELRAPLDNYDQVPNVPDVPVAFNPIRDETALNNLLKYGPRQLASFSAPARMKHVEFVWDSIGELTASEAVALLRLRASEREQAISIVGLSIRREHATIGGPLIIACILFYVLSHIKRSQELACSDQGDVGTAWQAIYPHWTGQVVAAGSTLVLPAVSCGLLLWTTREVGWGAFGVVAELVVLCLGLWTTREALRLRSKLSGVAEAQTATSKQGNQAVTAVPTFGRPRNLG
jgi:hypothetical protein